MGKKNARKTGGRKKGTPNKVTASVKAALLEAFEGVGGVPALVAWGKLCPGDFYGLWAKLLPQEVKTPDGEPFEVRVTEVVVATRAEADAVLKLNAP